MLDNDNTASTILYVLATTILVVVVGGNTDAIVRFGETLLGRLHLWYVLRTTDDDSTIVVGTVSGLFVHPVKSLRAVSLEQAEIDEMGFLGDRRFMLIVPKPIPLSGRFGPNDATHRFLTQRQCPSLATITSTLNYDENEDDNKKQYPKSVTLSHNNNKSTTTTVTVSTTTTTTTKPKILKAGIWDDVVDVIDMGDDVALFLRSIIENDTQKTIDDSLVEGVRFVAIQQQEEQQRVADDKYVPWMARRGTTTNKGLPQVGLTDGFPLLIVNEASLTELNDRRRKRQQNEKQENKPSINDDIPMNRFRPNIVVKTTKPFDEDCWKLVSIGKQLFHVAKGCPRCKQSCTNQETGEVYDEPLRTLSEFRALGKSPENVYFGQNAIPHCDNNSSAIIKVGDPVRVLLRGPPVWDKGSVSAEYC